MIAGVAAFLVLLPCATWLLGQVLGLLDGGALPPVLRRIAWRGLPFLAAGWLLGGAALLPAVAALLTALGLQAAGFFGLHTLVRHARVSERHRPWWNEPGG